jgi:hypothetical protein
MLNTSLAPRKINKIIFITLAGEEYARATGALTHILATIGSKAELKSTLCFALEVSGRDWAACLDKRQVILYDC